MHDPKPPYLEGHHPHHCGYHLPNDNLPHIHNPNKHPDDPSCGCHDHPIPDLHKLDVKFRFHEEDGETRGFHRTNVAYRDIILSALKNYPKLDEPQVAKAMWAFCQDIILRDQHGCCGVPVSEIAGESDHNICFTDHCGHELSKIQFYRTSNEAGVRIAVGEYSFGIRSFNGSAPETWTLYPSNPDSAQIARCDWVLDQIEGLLNAFLLNADNIPTQNSNNVVKSGGVYSWVLGLINQEAADRIAGDEDLQDQIDALDLSKYEMHQYPHSGHTTQVVSCDGIYKYGQDILSQAKAYCDSKDSGSGGSGSGSGSGSSSEESGTGGEEYTFGDTGGWRLWKSGKYAVLHVPDNIKTIHPGTDTTTLTIPINIASIIQVFQNKIGKDGGNMTGYTDNVILSSANTLTLGFVIEYDGPNDKGNNAYDIFCWLA